MDNTVTLKELSPLDVRYLQQEGKTFTIIDVRHEWEYKICKIDGALHIPLATLSENTHKIPTDVPILTVCHHGVRSKQAACILKDCGFTEVASLKGGIDAWANQVDSSLEKY